jgi:hypothetical protein
VETKPTPPQNIGPRGQRRRLLVGYATLAVGIVLAYFLLRFNVEPLLRLVLFVPFFFAYLCLFQANDKTCVFHAARGTCNLDQGTGPMNDPALATRLRGRARWIVVKAAIIAALWAALCYFINLPWADPS